MATNLTTAFLHYSAPPVVGGVEGVMQAHAQAFAQAGYPVTIVAGRGEERALPEGTRLLLIPEIDSMYPPVAHMSRALNHGTLPDGFDALVETIAGRLAPVLARFDSVIVHNVLGKHFNLPLTAALVHLLDRQEIRHCIAWGHDFSWTSPNSRSRVHDGYPWDLLRRYRPDVTYVVVSEQRRDELAGLYGCPPEAIKVIYNGVDVAAMLGLTPAGATLVERLRLLDSELNLLMPVRVTQAKNIELALRVVAALKKRGVRPRLVLTGPPDPHDSRSMAYFHSLQTLRRQLDVEQEMTFVFEAGPQPDEPFLIDLPVVGDLFRVSDVLFMPSHREGFGMPVLEAALAGLPVFVSEAVPAGREVGGDDVWRFSADADPETVADALQRWAQESRVHQLRRRVRQCYTWRAIFERDIEPLLPSPDALADRLAAHEAVWLFLDYDGTLADFAATPEDVYPDEALIDLLRRLVARPHLHMAIISGRQLRHIRKLVPVEGILLAGTYGIEIQDMDGHSYDTVPHSSTRPSVEEIKPHWEALIAGQDGFFLEDKGWALALHAKFASDAAAEQVLAAARQAAERTLDLETFRILGGNKFLEIGPRLAHKGQTVDYLLERYASDATLPVYAGDDDKDEEAFEAINARGGVSLVVASAPRPTHAAYRLASPSAVRAWLARLAG